MQKERPKISIKTKLVSIIILAFIILSFAVVYYAYKEARGFLKEGVYSHLSSILSTTGEWINGKLLLLKKDLFLFTKDPVVEDSIVTLRAFFEDLDDQNSFFEGVRESVLYKKPGTEISFARYGLYMQKLRKYTKEIEKIKGFKNILLIDAKSGYIYFETNLTDDFGTSLFKDRYSSSLLAKTFHVTRKLKEGEFYFSDFGFYKPYGDEPIAFFAKPIYNGKRPETVSVFVLPISTLKLIFEKITRLHPEFSICVVGKDHLFRVGTNVKNRDILHKKVVTEAVNKALSGKRGITREDELLVVYAPMEIFGKKWALIGKISQAIAFSGADKLKNKILSISFLIILIFSILIYIYIKQITSPIRKLTDMISKIIKKELPLDTNIEIKTGDEIEILSKSFNNLITLLRQEIDSISKFINILNRESESLEEVVRKEHDIVSTQASSISELAASLEEFSKTLETITKVNEQALEKFKDLKASAMENYSAQEKVIDGMEDLKKEMESIFALFGKIVEMNKDIKKIAEIIDNLSEQIKIIAFNASLEAARAGDAGKGFSVIAAQIRELLQNIQKQNIEIKKLIDENSENIEKISESSEKIAYFLNAEEANVNAITRFIKQVLELIEKNEEFISSISISQRQQRTAIEEFAISIKDIKEHIEEGKKLAEDIEESVVVLRELVEELNQIKNKMIR